MESALLGNELSPAEGKIEWIEPGPTVVEEAEGTPLVFTLGDADSK